MDSERDFSGAQERRWKAIASRLALTFAVCIMIGGAWGSWLDRKNMRLTTQNGTLLNQIEDLTDQVKDMGEQIADGEELGERNKELEKKVFDLSVKNATLEALLESSKVKNDPAKE
jgi:hypothetical protein